jgi:hypothetical protein
MTLKNNGLDIANYRPIVNSVKAMDMLHLTNEQFYQEIDKYLAPTVTARKLV